MSDRKLVSARTEPHPHQAGMVQVRLRIAEAGRPTRHTTVSVDEHLMALWRAATGGTLDDADQALGRTAQTIVAERDQPRGETEAPTLAAAVRRALVRAVARPDVLAAADARARETAGDDGQVDLEAFLNGG